MAAKKAKADAKAEALYRQRLSFDGMMAGWYGSTHGGIHTTWSAAQAATYGDCKAWALITDLEKQHGLKPDAIRHWFVAMKCDWKFWDVLGASRGKEYIHPQLVLDHLMDIKKNKRGG